MLDRQQLAPHPSLKPAPDPPALHPTLFTPPPPARDHKWDIFGPEESVDANDEIAGEALRSQDLFMAELSAVLSRGLRHVVAPPTATWHHHGYLHDTATPYASHVTFSIYEITEERHNIIHIGRVGARCAAASQHMDLCACACAA